MANNKIATVNDSVEATGLSSSLPGNKCITMDELNALVKPLTMSKLVTRIEYCSTYASSINGGNPKGGAIHFKYTDDDFYEFYPSEYQETLVSPIQWKEYDIKNASSSVIAQGIYRDFSHYIKIKNFSIIGPSNPMSKPTVEWSCGSSSFNSSNNSVYIIMPSSPDNGVYLIKLRMSMFPLVIGTTIPEINPDWNDNINDDPWIQI